MDTNCIDKHQELYQEGSRCARGVFVAFVCGKNLQSKFHENFQAINFMKKLGPSDFKKIDKNENGKHLLVYQQAE